ncbi:hypothetical protein PDE_09655 [Penicillium oxalicum 114-2]|uniref:AB hydrolase-1 domain-containing protein n=1 Tax=Penicillium oxalicum (strain 114-2 / CGMCC 5302) TaxID=933388 RepID=S8A0N0_PENO1|nr:hypothetical protein PDE_09655 [Penicillium oxalicum 114-2]
MDSQVTSRAFCTYTSSREDATTTVFFISGNPGLIGYYHPFLSLLTENLKQDQSPEQSVTDDANRHIDPSFQIYGRSLGGFEIDDDGNDEGDELGTSKARLYDLEDQICFVHGTLNALMCRNAAFAGQSLGKGPRSLGKRNVILVGHSVGAYIAMEVLRRHRETVHNLADPQEGDVHGVDFDIIGGVMLFPTVQDIAHSPSGRKLTTLLSIIPHFAMVIGFLASVLSTILPTRALQTLVKLVMANPPKHALETTTSFLKSRQGVRQALHMAADEMRTITSDKWTDDVWGVAHTREPLTELFFYFGRNDHWVAEKTRDEIIAMRGSVDREDGLGPKMIVCEEGLPHAFCLKHSHVMARKVAAMIQDIARGVSDR